MKTRPICPDRADLSPHGRIQDSRIPRSQPPPSQTRARYRLRIEAAGQPALRCLSRPPLRFLPAHLYNVADEDDALDKTAESNPIGHPVKRYVECLRNFSGSTKPIAD